MSDTHNAESFEEIVRWAYSTLPQKIRDLPDFPGIQVVDEPPEEVLKDVAKRRNWPEGTTMLGLFSGVYRTERQHFQTRTSPDLIFVFRGPILRCSKGNLRAEVKKVVWHEVAHWLGKNEEEVKELGLSESAPELKDEAVGLLESEESFRDKADEAQADGRERCIHCYAVDVTCEEVERPLGYSFDPVTVPTKVYKCNSCGYEWDDDDGG